MDQESQDTSSSLRRRHSFKVMRAISLHGISQNWLPGKVVKADDSPKPRLWWALLKSQGKIPREDRTHSKARTVGMFQTRKLTLYVGTVISSCRVPGSGQTQLLHMTVTKLLLCLGDGKQESPGSAYMDAIRVATKHCPSEQRAWTGLQD